MNCEWDLRKNDTTGHWFLLVNGENIDDALRRNKEMSEFSSVGHVVNVSSVSASTLKIAFSNKINEEDLLWTVSLNQFRPKTIHSSAFRNCITGIDFEQMFRTGSLVYSEDTSNGKSSKQNIDKTPVKATEKKPETPENRRIRNKYVGKFSIPIKFLKSPQKARRVRDLNEDFVSKLAVDMLEKKDISMQNPPSLTGYINVRPEEFSKSKLLNGCYEVETIDGNHSYHAQKSALNVSGDEDLTYREVAIYCQLTDDQCTKLGVTQNVRTQNTVPMSEYDYLKLLRRRLIQSRNDGGNEPPKTIPEEFVNFMYNLLELKTKKQKDAKGTLRFLATKTTNLQFGLVCAILDRRNVKLSKFRNLQGIDNPDTVTQFLRDLNKSNLTNKDFSSVMQFAKDIKSNVNNVVQVTLDDEIVIKYEKGARTITCEALCFMYGDVKIELDLPGLRKLVKNAIEKKGVEDQDVAINVQTHTTELSYADSEKEANEQNTIEMSRCSGNETVKIKQHDVSQKRKRSPQSELDTNLQSRLSRCSEKSDETIKVIKKRKRSALTLTQRLDGLHGQICGADEQQLDFDEKSEDSVRIIDSDNILLASASTSQSRDYDENRYKQYVIDSDETSQDSTRTTKASNDENELTYEHNDFDEKSEDSVRIIDSDHQSQTSESTSQSRDYDENRYKQYDFDETSQESERSSQASADENQLTNEHNDFDEKSEDSVRIIDSDHQSQTSESTSQSRDYDENRYKQYDFDETSQESERSSQASADENQLTNEHNDFDEKSEDSVRIIDSDHQSQTSESTSQSRDYDENRYKQFDFDETAEESLPSRNFDDKRITYDQCDYTFKEQPQHVAIGEWVLICPPSETEEKWIGEVRKSTKKMIYFDWVFNRQTDEWIGGGVMRPKGGKCNISQILASFNYENKLMPKELSKELDRLWLNKVT